jgi:hypothetical protein
LFLPAEEIEDIISYFSTKTLLKYNISFILKQLVAILTEDPSLLPSSINQTAKAKGVKYSPILKGIILIYLFCDLSKE